MSPELAARRLSGALGRRVDPEEVEAVVRDHVVMVSGETYLLCSGNVAYIGHGQWVRNGKAWNPHAADAPDVRNLTDLEPYRGGV